MKRRAFTLVEALVIVAVVMILVAILSPPGMFHGGSRQNARRSSCQHNLKQIGLCFVQYTQDYDDRFPPAAINPTAAEVFDQNGNSYGTAFGWADVLRPYLKSTQVLQCISEESSSVSSGPTASGYTDYWYNKQLTKANAIELKSPATTILDGDGNDGTDATSARYSKAKLPASWLSNPNSPAYRHLDGANYGFADGHVRWLKPSKVTSFPVARRMPTFAVR